MTQTKNIYLASLIQETNTFCPRKTELADFIRGYIHRGMQIKEQLAATNTEMNGFLSSFENSSHMKLVPGVAAWALASGKITKPALDSLVSEILNGIEPGNADGILLALHGALVCDDCDDCEGYVIQSVRDRVGQDVPIVCTLDFHANVTDLMVEAADVLVGFRTYPHTDFEQTGCRAAEVMKKLLNTKPRPQKIFKKLPIILPVENTETATGPIASIMRQIEQFDSDNNLCAGSIFVPHPWLDIEDFNVSVLFYADEQARAGYESLARELLNRVWDSRAEFYFDMPSIQECLIRLDEYQKPIILVDSGDITSAGGLGDSTEILRALLADNKRHNAVLATVDPVTVEKAVLVGAGNNAQFEIGGLHNAGYTSHTTIMAHVSRICEEAITVQGASFSGLKLNMGRRVLLTTANDIKVIVFEFASLMHDAQVVKSMGVELEKCDIIVQKSHKLFRASYQDIARSIVAVDTGGFTSRNIKSLPYIKIRRPIYPLDEVSAPLGLEQVTC